MRPVLHGDVSALARAVCALPGAERRRRIARALAGAEVADAHRRRTGRAHREFGTGSVMAMVATWPRIDEPDFDDDAYCLCWIEVLQALIRHRACGEAGQAEAQATQSCGVGSMSGRPSGTAPPHSRQGP